MNDRLALQNASSRDKRKAKTRLALVSAAAQRIEVKPFETISVKELCSAVNVSETTFFNYFTRKSDLMAYCVQIWNLEIIARATQAAQGRRGLAMIGELFEQVGLHVQGRPGLTGEIMAYLAKRREDTRIPMLTLLEKQIALPEFPDIGDIELQPIDEVFKEQVRWAIENGELPEKTNLEAVATSLTSLFFGVPVALHTERMSVIQQYRRQLNLVWLGVRNAGQTRARPALNGPTLHHRDA